jgi:dolichol kinase
MSESSEISFSQEVLRKGIHLISLSIPIIYIFVTRETALYILVSLAIMAIVIDFLSKFDNIVGIMLKKYFGKMLRPHELNQKYVLNGASWVFISAVVCVFIFPKFLAVVGFTILIIADISAALFGRKYGKHKLFTNKSWEGTFAFIVSAITVIFIYGLIFNAPIIFFFGGIIASLIGGFVEAASTKMKVDDNLSIPLSVSSVLFLFGLYADSILTPFLHLIK